MSSPYDWNQSYRQYRAQQTTDYTPTYRKQHPACISATPLLSPPSSKKHDSFDMSPSEVAMHYSSSSPIKGCSVSQGKMPVQMPSPEISPRNKAAHAFSNPGIHRMDVDPPVVPDDGTRHDFATPLFPPSQRTESADLEIDARNTQAPLASKEPVEAIETHQRISSHIKATSHQFRAPTERPTNQDYLLMANMFRKMTTMYNESPKDYLRDLRKFNSKYTFNRLPHHRITKPGQNLRPLAPASASAANRRQAGSPSPTSRKINVATPKQPVRPRATTKRSAPRKKIAGPNVKMVTPSKPRSSATKVDVSLKDRLEFAQIPNYAPDPNTTLPRLANGEVDPLVLVKAMTKTHNNFKGPEDDMMAQLHPAERQLAIKCGLSGWKYAAQKRRIFKAIWKRKKFGLEVKRTHAQEACSIDVNKASSMLEAWQSVGWDDPKHYVHFDMPEEKVEP